MDRGAAGSSRLVDALIHKIHRHLGMDFSGARRGDLLRRLRSLAEGSFESWLDELAFSEWNAATVQALVPAFSVGETYFRRDASAFDWLSRQHLMPLIAARREAGIQQLRLWSAACCTGEEAYGLLFLIDDLLGAERASWQVELLATDINDRFLTKARDGVYGRNSFRGDDQAFRNRFFEGHGERWRVRAAWRERIRFERFNLAAGQPAPMQGADVILCRNVLMYFSPAQARASLQRLAGALSADGALLLSAVEAGIATEAGLTGLQAGSNYALRSSVAEPAQPQRSLAAACSRGTGAASVRAWPPQPRAQSGNKQHRHEPQRTPLLTSPRRVDVDRDGVDQPRTAQSQPLSANDLEARLAIPGADSAERQGTMLRLARFCADRNDLGRARDWLLQAIQIDATTPTAYLLLAMLEDRQGRIEPALQALNKVLYLQPDCAVAYLLQARLARAKGQPRIGARALRECRRLLANLPAEAEVEHAEGLCAGQLLDLCQAMEGGDAA